MTESSAPIVRTQGWVEYEPCFHAMQAFTEQRTADTQDELWIVEHPPVFTLGQAGLPSHLLHATEIPLVQTDRGGQITYHGSRTSGDLHAVGFETARCDGERVGASH